MRAREFVEKLSEIIVDIDFLRAEGLDEQYINEVIQSYKAKIKTDVAIVSGYPVVELIENYDCSTLEIGMITFNKQIAYEENYIVFGKCEADDLVVDVATKKVLVLESGLDHILYECAQNDSMFLDALFHLALFLNKKRTDASLYDNIALNLNMAEEFGEIAGGPEFYDFYKMMLAV